MSEQSTAEIISFPRSAPDRLKRALVDLDHALSEQRAAVAVWQGTMRDLRESLSKLRTTLVGYDVALKSLSTNVGSLNAESRRLENWADGAMRTATNISVTDKPGS